MTLGPRAFLKKSGFLFDTKPTTIDKRFLSAFSVEDREKIHSVWEDIHLYGKSTELLYALPRSRKQAAILASHDAERSLATMSWFKLLVSKTQPNNIIEFGCGAGFLLEYINSVSPSTFLAGVDRLQNQVDLVPVSDHIKTYCCAYDDLATNTEYDLAICDVGFDNNDIPKPSPSQKTEYIGEHPYYPNWSEDMQPFFHELLSPMKAMLNKQGILAFVGRLGGPTELKALFDAATQLELSINRNLSSRLSIGKTLAQREYFRALVFSDSSTCDEPQNLEGLLNM